MNPKENNDYKMMLDLLKEMDNNYKMLKSITLNSIKENYGLGAKTLDALLTIKKEAIETMSVEDMKAFLTKFIDDETEVTVDVLVSSRMEETEDATEESVLRAIMTDIKTQELSLLDSKNDIESLKADADKIAAEYNNYLNSEEATEKREAALARLKETIASGNPEDSDVKKALKQIKAIEESQSLAFMYERLDTYGQKEIDKIKDAFFKEQTGSYVIDKFKGKIKLFGFEKDTYKYFFNMEENFLDEEYHAYNNLFLFIYMRFVAYSDPYNATEKMYVQAITSTMAKLIYHKFPSTEAEENFLTVMKTVLDHFASYSDYFATNNTTQPNHPMRKAADEKRDADWKAQLIGKMDDMGITGYDPEASAKELQEYLNAEVERLVKEQTTVKEETEETVDVTEDEDGVTTIEPVMEPADAEEVTE